MNETELKLWFLKKLNSCYTVSHSKYPENIFWIYDEKYIRKCKLSKINNSDISKPTEVNGYCIFEMDFHYKYFYCDYLEIWSVMVENLWGKYDSYTHNMLKDIISELLEQHFKLQFEAKFSYLSDSFEYFTKDEIHALTPDTMLELGDLIMTEKEFLTIL
jgi:hypothetical protein